MSSQYLNAMKTRRTQYALGKTLPLSKDEVVALIKEAVRQAPSSFNSQSSRVVVLFGDQSVKMWGLVKEVLRGMLPADAFPATEAKLDSFAAGAGTVLFYEDQAVVSRLQEQFALYAENFPIWSEQASGMAQLAVWTALAEAGIGASLQHYSPLADAQIAQAWDVPSSWKLRAQLPFGSNQQPIGDKQFMADEQRFIVAG